MTCLRPYSSEVMDLKAGPFISSPGRIPLREAGFLPHSPFSPTALDVEAGCLMRGWSWRRRLAAPEVTPFRVEPHFPSQ